MNCSQCCIVCNNCAHLHSYEHICNTHMGSSYRWTCACWLWLRFYVSFCVFPHLIVVSFVVNISAVVCLERLTSEMTYICVVTREVVDWTVVYSRRVMCRIRRRTWTRNHEQH